MDSDKYSKMKDKTVEPMDWRSRENKVRDGQGERTKL